MPGKTTLEEAVELLRESEFVAPDSIRVDREGGQIVADSEATIYWQSKTVPPEDDLWSMGSWDNLVIVRDDNTVDSIMLLVNTTACSLAAGQVVERYGPPEKVLFTPRGVAPHIIWHTLDLYYFTQGLAFIALADDPPRREQEVGIVYTFAPSSWPDGFLSLQPRRYLFERLVYDEEGFLRDWGVRLEDWQGFANETP